MTRRKFLLNDLNCANCARKIEEKIRKMPQVKSAFLNFVTKELTIEVSKNIDFIEFEEQVKKIVKETEEGVEVCEITQQSNTSKVSFLINGLNCTNCANNIEKLLSGKDYVKSAFVDLVNQKIVLEVKRGLTDINLLEEVRYTVNSVEHGVKVEQQQKTTPFENESRKSKNIRMILGTIAFITVFFIDNNSWYYIPVYLVSYFLIGWDVLYKAIKNIFNGNVFDENFLMAIATIGAFAIGEYPEAVAVMLFYMVGELFQDMAVNKSRRSIKNLLSIRPDTANILIDGEVKSVMVEDVLIGDIMVVKPGERIALDGLVLEGESTLDTKSLTGESLPLPIKVGDRALSGCININGLLHIKVGKLSGESTVSRVLELVEDAASKKAKTENFISKFAAVYTPIVTFSALLLAIIPPLFFHQSFAEWSYRAFVFLVISCPCALVISIPLSYFGGIGAASKQGILIKGSNYLEALNNIDVSIFDKTGTLTEGVFEVTKIYNEIGFEKEEILKIAAYAESSSNHPIAQSILKAYAGEIKKDLIEVFEEVPGLGIICKINGVDYKVGNLSFMEKHSVTCAISEDFGSIIYVSKENHCIGYIVISDKIKVDAFKTIRWFRKHNISTVMLTGDKKEVADYIGESLKIDHVYKELLPDKKLSIVEEIINSKKKTLYLGDGINDTPVIARADVGVAMGGLGADAAIDIADVVIMSDEPSKIIDAIKIAKKTRRIVVQNIVFALGVKVFVLGLGSLGLAYMWEAVFADVGVSIIAILNSLRILRYKSNI